MGRIIFMTPFSRMEITGGIKTNYQHAELLAELGFDACIYQPDGQPKWFKSGARRLVGERLLLASDDVVVFPEGCRASAASSHGHHPPQPRCCSVRISTMP